MLAPELHGPVDQRGEVDVHGDVGLARFVEGVGAEMVGPVGAERSLDPALLQVLGGVAVVDEQDGAGVESVEDRFQPFTCR